MATYELKVILSIVSMRQVGINLFRETALLRLVVAAKDVPIQSHESSYTLELIQQA